MSEEAQDTTPTWRNYWPMFGFEPRPSQVTVMDWMENLPADVKYVLCEIPVGGGKSPIALNYTGYLGKSLYTGSSFILTPQRILQRQYEESFDPNLIASVYGKANYECKPKGTNCEIGSDIKPKCSACPAKNAFGTALSSPNMVMNYKLALLNFQIRGPDLMGTRDLMVFDECHTLEEFLTEHQAITISENRCKYIGLEFKEQKKTDEAFQWIIDVYIPALNTKMQEISRTLYEINERSQYGEPLTNDDKRFIRRAKQLQDHKELLTWFSRKSLEDLHEEYVLVPDKTNFKFKELYGKRVFNSLVKPMANKFLFMSSTILNKDAFCQDLGINPDEAAIISLDSEFPIESRPIYFMPTTKMAAGWNKPENKSEIDKMAKKITDICNMHSDECGVIHTGSFKIAEWVIREIQSNINQRIIHHNPESGLSRDDVIDEFTKNDGEEPMILVSPSVTEGLDLKYDAARFTIFAKVPFPYMGDNWVKRRMDISKEWYQRQALVNVIQGGGRVVRSDDDWGNVYILDSSFTFLYNTMKKHIPVWWKDSFTKVESKKD